MRRNQLCSRNYLRVCLRRPLSKYGATYTHLVAAHRDGALKVLAHAHAQLERGLVEPELPGHEVALLAQQHKVLVLVLRRGGDAARDGADGHEAEQPQVRAVLCDGVAQRHRVGAGRAAGLGLLAGRVDLHVDVEPLHGGLGGDEVAAGPVQQLRLLERVDAGDAPQVGDLGDGLAVCCE